MLPSSESISTLCKRLLIFLLTLTSIGYGQKQDSYYETYGRGIELYDSAQYENALIEFYKIAGDVEMDSSNSLKYHIATSHFALKQYEKAAAFYEMVFVKEPVIKEAYLFAGVC